MTATLNFYDSNNNLTRKMDFNFAKENIMCKKLSIETNEKKIEIITKYYGFLERFDEVYTLYVSFYNEDDEFKRRSEYYLDEDEIITTCHKNNDESIMKICFSLYGCENCENEKDYLNFVRDH